tara:strand:+ start:1528 stop:1764 length:237 start_codon:yes stop_codon:yes gene_type:complete
MSKKKSYMDKSNIIKESILKKVFRFLFKDNAREIDKLQKKNPDFRRRVKTFNKDMEQFTKYLQKHYPNEDPMGKNWNW